MMGASDWTVATLKEHFDSLRSADQEALRTALDGAKTATDAALAAAEKATSKAEIAADKRFEAVNEFRAQLADQASTFMPRLEAEQRIGQITDRYAELLSRFDKTEGRSGGVTAAWGYLVGAAGVLIGIAGLAVVFVR